MSFFSFENLGGNYPELGEALQRGIPTAVYGVSDVQKYLIASLCTGRCVYLAADALAAKRAADAIRALSGKRVCLLSAKDEVLLYRDALSKDALFRRLTALYEWRTGAEVMVCDVEAAVQLVPARIPFFRLEAGKETPMRELIDALVEAGYTREYAVDGKGAFAVRGDILDIYPVNCEHPVRIDFFGDEVESIKPYDETTGDRYPLLSTLDIVAATDVVLAEGEGEEIGARMRKETAGAKSAERAARLRAIAQAVADRGYRSDYVLPLTKNACDLFSLAGDALVILDESKSVKDKLEGLYKEHYDRLGILEEGGEAMSFTAAQYIPAERIRDLSGRRVLSLSAFLSDPYFFRALKTMSFTATPARRYLNSLPDLITDLAAWRKTGYRVMLCCGLPERKQKLIDELNENNVPLSHLPNDLADFRGVAVTDNALEHGFVLHECKLAVVGAGDLFSKPPQRRLKKRRGDLFFAPEVGDYAVHDSYGVGKITGTEKIETSEGVKEYVSLVYKDGDVLHVPVEQMDALSKYVGEDNPTLSKIGGGEFERVKARVRASLKKMAFDLKALYAERREQKGYVFPDYFEEMDEFEAAFPFEDTPDQRVSTDEILSDMRSPKVMDRLLCGDVGFGKTEVALRAAYLCILAGRQAAILCPSTVLSEQHLVTATERMEPFGVKVRAINRFRTEKEQQTILGELERGEIDLIVGTHRLLSKDVKFRDLGLLVLDEEQRFGVEHKEKIKNYKRDVDCLTMTATPIPRTLHLSLSGIRDISTIQTPPHARMPVQTYVAEESETLIRDACVREIARRGQIFILYNRVESIAAFAKRISDIVPEARVTYAHGRMEKATLERNVFSFYRGEYDVLVTTTIIENGIDLPNANTLVVIDSDRLGISQLYQLRGRVGRGARLAHAYFTYKAERVMTESATDRLKAIMQFTELGSGFKIAMRDLEIRGAGNVLGAEQHGHMDKVGYELYSKILKEELTGEKQTSVELDIRTTAFIPESYIESNAGRMDCYKQIAEIKNNSDYKRVCVSLEETYGPPPPETVNLLVIAMLKSYAARFGVCKITLNQKGGAFEFSSLAQLRDDRLSAAMEKYKSRIGLDMTVAPTLRFYPLADGAKTLVEMTKFLKFAATFA